MFRWNRTLILCTTSLALRTSAFASNSLRPSGSVTARSTSFTASRPSPTFSSSSLAMSKTVLVPIAHGSEEIETTCITDTLTRFGAKVTIASVSDSLVCTMSRGIQVQADCHIRDCTNKDWDLIALPGGMPGAEHLRDCAELIDLLKKQKAAGKLYGAICAAPAVSLASHGLIDDGVPSTCYPAPKFRDMLSNVQEEAVVVSGNLVTSQGPGTAVKFALQLGEELYGREKRSEIAKEMLVE